MTNEVDAVLHFWLEETPPEQRFKQSDALDAEIERRFGALNRRLADGVGDEWRQSPRATLAAVIVLDQFSRNLHRGSPAAYAQDEAARDLSRAAIAKGWHVGMDSFERQFLFMPFMHSEEIADQRWSMALFAEAGNDLAYDFARRHYEQIERFGRFPQRNVVLGRESTAEEVAFLETPGAAF